MNLSVGTVVFFFAMVSLGMLAAGKPLVVSLLPLVLGGAAFLWIWRHSMWTIDIEPYDEVELYENGLLGRAGRKQRALLWSEVSSYEVGLYQPPLKVTADGVEPTRSHGTKVHFSRDGDGDFEVMLSGIAEGDALMAEVSPRIMAHLLPAALETVRSGRAMEFGPLSVDATGIHRGARTVTWDDFDAFVENPGSRVAVRDVNGKESLHSKASELPNQAVLHALIQRLQAERSAG
ncbi:DUF6585 family protein [Streptomyces sp. NPDC051555]|uniref:DUF6585 family protein n=1 Tax=Streptomyces sp. NPDC051555 TaxID=3365657 RepID=UPI0037A5905C